MRDDPAGHWEGAVPDRCDDRQCLVPHLDAKATVQVQHFQSPDDLFSAVQASAGMQEFRLTIRELLEVFGARRRGTWVVEEIQTSLDDHGIVTMPSFENGPIDTEIVLRPDPRRDVAGLPERGDDLDLEVPTSAPSTATARFSDLPTADAGVTAVASTATVREAQSVMMAKDFSQLPVLAGERELRGVVSWESIARARMHLSNLTLSDVMIRDAQVVNLHDEMLAHVPEIIRRGFVFVRRPDRKINGVVTTTDLSQAFQDLAGPFFLVGDVERLLRRVLAETFTVEELRSVRDPLDVKRVIRSVDDMTVGEYVRMLENPAHWERLGWDVERRTFLQSLEIYRQLRNEVMHFSPDPLEQARLSEVRNLLIWLRVALPDKST